MENNNEIWAPVTDYINYEVSSLGNVRNILTGKPVNIQTHSLGYRKVSLIDYTKELYETGRWRCKYLHVIVAKAFLPNPNGYPEVNHKDHNKSNNAVENLEWCTHRENIRHSCLTRTMPKGKEHWRYGIKSSEETRKKISQGKIGSKHPKFKGWYVYKTLRGNKTVTRVYESAITASKDTGFVQKTIIRWSRAGLKGWSFRPKEINKNVEFEITNEVTIPKRAGTAPSTFPFKETTLQDIREAVNKIKELDNTIELTEQEKFKLYSSNFYTNLVTQAFKELGTPRPGGGYYPASETPELMKRLKEIACTPDQADTNALFNLPHSINFICPHNTTPSRNKQCNGYKNIV